MLKSSDSTGDRRCNCAGHGKTALLYGNVCRCVGVWVGFGTNVGVSIFTVAKGIF